MKISETKGFDVREISRKFHDYTSRMVRQYIETEKQLQELNKKIVAQQTQASNNSISSSHQQHFGSSNKKTSPNSKVIQPSLATASNEMDLPLEVLFKDLTSLKKQFQLESESLEKIFHQIECKVTEMPDISSFLLGESFKIILDYKNNFINKLRMIVLNVVLNVLKDRENKARRILPPSYASLPNFNTNINTSNQAQFDDFDDTFWESSEVIHLIDQGTKMKNQTLNIHSFSEFDSNLGTFIYQELFESLKGLINGRFQKNLSFPIDEPVFHTSIQCMAYVASILTHQNKEVSLYLSNNFIFNFLKQQNSC